MIDDLDGLRVEAQRSRALGYGGKSCIHPCQVATINEVFSPTAAEVAWARQVIATAAATSGGAGRGPGDEMVDPAVARRARWILDQAENP